MEYKEFVKELSEYESDTFSASAEKVTKEEAIQLVESAMESFRNNYLDGVWLSSMLEGIREDKN